MYRPRVDADYTIEETGDAPVMVYDLPQTEEAKRFEAANPGTKIEMQYLENESFKKKLTTLLQSPDKPHIVYSWAGGVLREQVKAGVIQDITAAVDAGGWRTRFGTSGLQAYTVGGKLYGLPMLSSQVGFFYSKPLFAKGAQVDKAEVSNGSESEVALVAPQNINVTIPAGMGAPKMTMKVRYEGPIAAPIKAGDHIADLVVTTPDTPPAVVPLVAGADIEEAGFFRRIWLGILSFFGF